MRVPKNTSRALSALAIAFLLLAVTAPCIAQAVPQPEPTDAAPAPPQDAVVPEEDVAPGADVAPEAVATAAPPADAPATDAEEAHEGPHLTASFDDGFSVDSENHDFGVRIGALIQYRVNLNETASGRYDANFQSFMTRPQIRMHAFGNQLKVFIQPEFGGTGSKLLDLELTYQPHEAFALRAGQFLTPFSRIFLTPVPLLQFVDFGVPNDFFRVNRDTGVMAFGTAADGRFEYYLGAFNGNTINRDPSERVRGMGVARLVVAPLGKVPYDATLFLRESQPFRFALGVNGYMQRVVPVHTQVDLMTGQIVTVRDPERNNRTLGTDLQVFYERFALLAEMYYRAQQIAGTPGTTHALGAFAQAAYYIPVARLELSTRVGYVDPNRDTPGNSVHTYEGALTGYVRGNHAKVALRYMFADAGAAMSGLYVGQQHRLTLQTQVFF
jgi:hypothetical protein